MRSKSQEIEKMDALEVLDSRGTPTVRARVMLADGATGCATVPSGASTGAHEAREIRDGGDRYGGKGVLRAVETVRARIAPALRGLSALDQTAVDEALKGLDGGAHFETLGANAALAVSMACARAAAASQRVPLFRHLGGRFARILPVPMMNVLNGGAHAANNLDIQEFMIRPVGAKRFSDALRMGADVYRALRACLIEAGLSVGLGDEGGFCPDLAHDEDALALLMRAIERAGYTPGADITLALDVAASGWSHGGAYRLKKRGTERSRAELIRYYEDLCREFPIDSLEDPLDEEDFEGFAALRKRVPRVQVVGDDLFTTSVKRLLHGIEVGAADAVLVKPNQIGTVSDAMDCVRIAQASGLRTVISHRSGESEDDFIADLAVATNAGQIKTGAPARSDRNSKYNRLLEIERALLDGGDESLM